MVVLEASKVFNPLNPDELGTLRTIAQERQYADGQQIFKEGDSGDGIYVVKDGQVEISALVAPKTRLVFSRIEPGDFFGELAVLDSKPRSACALAKGPTAVYFIPREGMMKLVEHSPALSMTLLQAISQRLREFNRQYLREVLQAERLAVVGRFARTIVHDLKNPLNLIGLTAEMAGMEKSTPEMRQRAKAMIRKQVERITDLIGEIIEFTQGPHTDLVLTPMCYGEFVAQVLEELRPEMALKSVLLEIEGDVPSVDLPINPKRLQRVFHNLIHNAADVLPEGGKVFLRFRLEPKEVVTEIEDTGPGIPPEVADRLFEAFATFGKPHGTGLGLSICKRIVQDHHGWIAARNAPQRGAIFSFGLPRPSAPSAE